MWNITTTDNKKGKHDSVTTSLELDDNFRSVVAPNHYEWVSLGINIDVETEEDAHVGLIQAIDRIVKELSAKKQELENL